MKRNKFIQLLIGIILLGITCSAHATITCTAPFSLGILTAYIPTGVLPNYTQGSFSTTCTRSSAADPTTVLVKVNDGANATGVQNRAFLVLAGYLSYETYQDSSCTIPWTNASIGGMISLTLANVLTPQIISPSYWVCITIGSQVASAGIFGDTVTMQVMNNTNTLALSTTGTFGVLITNLATCDITSVQNVGFGTYIAFQNTPLVSPAANILMNCTLYLPYTMALDSPGGVVVGLNYSLALSATGQLRGIGLGQLFTITGTMPAGQAGTCSTGSCSGSDTRTLTITY